MILDSTLTWKPHIEKICKTVCSGILYKIRPFVNIKVLKTLYYSLIYPHLNYAIEIWGSADNIHLNHIMMLQKRVVRLIYYLDKRQPDYSFPSADPLFYKLDFLKINQLFQFKIANFIFSCLNKLNPPNFHYWFKLTTLIHKHNTRSKIIDIESMRTSNNLFIPFARTSHYGLKSIKVQGPKIWNTIPPLIRINTSPNSFKKKLKNYLMTLY